MPPPDDDTRATSNLDVAPITISSNPLAPAGSGSAVTQFQPGTPTQMFQPLGLPVIPGYAIRDEVARGGMGVVYSAHDSTFDREVAIKVMHPGQDASRFIVESKVTAQLPHPGIPPVYALGTFPDGRPFLAMKLIEGHTLAHELQQAKRETDLPRLLGIFEQICLTVGFAHSRSIIHRDLKPANVMVGRFGEVLVMDWGLAKQVNRGQTDVDGEATESLSPVECGAFETVAGQVKGTPSFMAPEQARGETVDARADVFALGGILAVMLTGQPPFLDNSVLATVLKAAQAELDECFQQLDASGADAELVAVAKKSMAAKPDDRFIHGEEIASAMAAYRDGVEERLRNAETERAAAGARSTEQRKRRRVQRALFGAMAALVALLVLSAWWQNRQNQQRKLERSEADTRTAQSEATRLATEKEAEAQNSRNETARADVESAARKTVLRQMIDLSGASGLTAAREGDHSLALLWFARAANLAKDEPEQAEVNRIRYANWLRHDWTPEGTFTVPGFRQNQDRFRTVQFSPDGNYLLAIANIGDYLVWDRPGERLVQLPGPAAHGSAAAWNPKDGSLAVGGKDAKIRVLAPPNFTQVEEVPAEGEVSLLAFSRDGRYLAWGEASGAQVWDREKREYSTPYLPHGGQVATFAFSAASDLLATSAHDGKARVFRTVSAEAEPLFPAVPHVIAGYGISHGGPERVAPRFADEDKVLLTVERNSSSYLLAWRSPTTGKLIVNSGSGASSGFDYLSAFDVSPQGDRVAVSWGGISRVYNAQNRTILAAVPVLSGYCEDLNYSADGKSVSTCGYPLKTQVWSVENPVNFNLTPSSSPIQHSQTGVRTGISANGRHMAVALWDGTICLWHEPQNPPVAFEAKAGGTTLPALSPDGRLVLPRGTSFRGGTMLTTAVRDASTGKLVGARLDPGGIIVDAAFSPDGTQVALATLTARTSTQRNNQMFLPDGQAGNVQLWDWKSGKRLTEPVPLPAEPRGLAFRPDGRTLAVVCADYLVVLVEPASGTVRHHLDPGIRTKPWNANLWKSNGEARFSADGRFLLTWERVFDLHIWDPDSGRLLHTLAHTERVEHVAFNPAVPNILAAGGRDSMAKVWDVATGKMISQLQHTFWLTKMQFSPDGSELITAAVDDIIRVWNWRTGELKRALPQTSHFDFGFTSDRRWLVAMGVFSLQITDWRSGTPVSPAWNLRDGIHVEMVVPAGDRRAVVGGFSGSLVGYDLEKLVTPVAGSAEDLIQLAELVAGRRILDQGNIVPLTSAEWAERWRWLQQNDDMRKLTRASTTTDDGITQAAQSKLRVTLGVALWNGGKKTEALEAFREAVRLDPADALARDRLAFALLGTNNSAAAMPVAEEAVRLDPAVAQAHWNLGRARAGTGYLEGALISYKEAIKLDPKHVSSHNSLAWSLATGPERVRDGKQAIEYATRACELTDWKAPNNIDTLAAAYAEANDFDKAVECQKKALSFSSFEREKGAGARQRLDLYSQNKPYHDPAFAPREVAPPPHEVKR